LKRRPPRNQAAAMGRKRSPAPSTSFVLDCSVAVAWFFEDETNAYAEAVEDSLLTSSALVPSLWPPEIANALIVGVVLVQVANVHLRVGAAFHQSRDRSGRSGPRGPGGTVPRITSRSSAGNGGGSAIGRAILHRPSSTGIPSASV
jgi:hypothetical protein